MQSPFPGMEGAVFDSAIATLGPYRQSAGLPTANNLAPFICTMALPFIHAAAA
jgi:hypothetical protein